MKKLRNLILYMYTNTDIFMYIYISKGALILRNFDELYQIHF